jgi:hypothetical protein
MTNRHKKDVRFIRAFLEAKTKDGARNIIATHILYEYSRDDYTFLLTNWEHTNTIHWIAARLLEIGEGTSEAEAAGRVVEALEAAHGVSCDVKERWAAWLAAPAGFEDVWSASVKAYEASVNASLPALNSPTTAQIDALTRIMCSKSFGDALDIVKYLPSEIIKLEVIGDLVELNQYFADEEALRVIRSATKYLDDNKSSSSLENARLEAVKAWNNTADVLVISDRRMAAKILHDPFRWTWGVAGAPVIPPADASDPGPVPTPAQVDALTKVMCAPTASNAAEIGNKMIGELGLTDAGFTIIAELLDINKVMDPNVFKETVSEAVKYLEYHGSPELESPKNYAKNIWGRLLRLFDDVTVNVRERMLDDPWKFVWTAGVPLMSDAKKDTAIDKGIECLLRVLLSGSRTRACRMFRFHTQDMENISHKLLNDLCKEGISEYFINPSSLDAASELLKDNTLNKSRGFQLSLGMLTINNKTDKQYIRTIIAEVTNYISELADDGDMRAARARTRWDAFIQKLPRIEKVKAGWKCDIWLAFKQVVANNTNNETYELEAFADEIERKSQFPQREILIDDKDDGAKYADPIVKTTKFVIHGIGNEESSQGKDCKRVLSRIVAKPVPLVVAPDDLSAARKELTGDAPHAARTIDVLLSDLRPGRPVRIRPTILLGPPGSGKSRLVRHLGEVLGVRVSRFDGSGSSDNAFGGTPRRWSSGEPCFPIVAIMSANIANPIVMIDEVDKAGTSVYNGSLVNSLLPMLEQETAKRFADPYVQDEVDLSAVSYIMTANDDKGLPAPLRDRCRILRVPEPSDEHVEALVVSVVRDLVEESGDDERSVEPLAADEIEIVRKLLGERRSVRRIREIVERLLAGRERLATRH